jgi:hypothetical protein
MGGSGAFIRPATAATRRFVQRNIVFESLLPVKLQPLPHAKREEGLVVS